MKIMIKPTLLNSATPYPKKNPLARVISLNCAFAALSPFFFANHAAAALEEIVVTARKKAESMQEVPVTVNAVSERTLKAFKIDQVEELSSLVPNLSLQTSAGVGSGSSVRLRGIGNDANSAAFDTAVSFNIDGAQFNTGRIMQTAMFDVAQVEVLKGPQSLFFGKSSSAGVITLRSNEPTEEFAAEISASRELEEKGTQLDGFISGPLTETIGARLAFRFSEVDEVMLNTAGPGTLGSFSGNAPPSQGGFPTYLAPSASGPADRWRGNESQDVRLTLTWSPTDNLDLNFKAHTGEYKQDGINLLADLVCLPGSTSTAGGATAVGSVIGPQPYVNDCDHLDAKFQMADLGDFYENGGNHPDAKGSRPFFEQEVTNLTLKATYDISENLSLISVSNWFDIDSTGSDNFTFTAVNVGTTPYQKNTRENWSQEFRLESDFGGSFDYALGAYYQERELGFNVSQTPLGFGFLAGPDIFTGRVYDYYREHSTDTEAISFFGNLIFRPAENVEISAGARWSREEHDNTVDVVHTHFAGVGAGLLTPPGSMASAQFTDENVSPEVTISWQPMDNINLYAAYKTGFKSGGIDNSLLPIGLIDDARLQAESVFDSEETSGFEIGMKADLLENTLRLNVAAYHYVVEDLQVQTFDATKFAFFTGNAGELTSKGIEVDLTWELADRLILTSALTYTDSGFTDDFMAPNNKSGFDNMNGEPATGNSLWAGTIGLDYSYPLEAVVLNFNARSNFRSDFRAGNYLDSYHQGGFAKYDASFSIEDDEERWQLAVVGQNLADKRTVNLQVIDHPNGDLGTNGLNPVVQISHGRLVSLEAKYRF